MQKCKNLSFKMQKNIVGPTRMRQNKILQIIRNKNKTYSVLAVHKHATDRQHVMRMNLQL